MGLIQNAGGLLFTSALDLLYRETGEEKYYQVNERQIRVLTEGLDRGTTEGCGFVLPERIFFLQWGSSAEEQKVVVPPCKPELYFAPLFSEDIRIYVVKMKKMSSPGQ